MGSLFLGVPLGYKSKPDWVQPPDAEDRTSGGVEGSRELKARDPIRSVFITILVISFVRYIHSQCKKWDKHG